MPDSDIHIVVPYAGRADYLRETVLSVLAQSDPGWKLTVVEDSDQNADTARWLEELGDVRVTHVLNRRRLGISGNFQRCLDLSQGEYVVFPGCDDVLLPNYIATVRSLTAAHPAAAAVQPGVEVIDAQGRAVRPLPDRIKAGLTPRHQRPLPLSGERAMTSILHGNWTYFPSICWRRDVIAAPGFRQDLPTTLDLALLAEVLLAGHDLLVSTSPPVFRYRRHGASASAASARDVVRFAEERRLFSEIEGKCRSRSWGRAARSARRHVTSRLHAATLLPASVAGREPARTRELLRHLLAGRRRSTKTFVGPTR